MITVTYWAIALLNSLIFNSINIKTDTLKMKKQPEKPRKYAQIYYKMQTICKQKSNRLIGLKR